MREKVPIWPGVTIAFVAGLILGAGAVLVWWSV